MKRRIMNDINTIFNSMNTLGDGSYITFIHADSNNPWGTYETVNIVKVPGYKGYKIDNRNYTKKEVINFMRPYIEDNNTSTMIGLKDRYGNTKIFYNSDKGNMYYYN